MSCFVLLRRRKTQVGERTNDDGGGGGFPAERENALADEKVTDEGIFVNMHIFHG